MKFLLDLLAAIFKRPAPAAAPVPEPAPDVPAGDQLVRMVTAAGCSPDRAPVVTAAFTHAFERFGVTATRTGSGFGDVIVAYCLVEYAAVG